MSDTSIGIVILSERSLPAVAGESKDLYLPRLPRLPAEARGLHSRPLWSAAVRAALHSFRLSTPLRKSGPGVAASVRRSPYAMSDSSASTVILPALSKVEGSERSLPAVVGESKDLYLPRLAPLSPNRDSQAGVSFPYSPFAISKEVRS